MERRERGKKNGRKKREGSREAGRQGDKKILDKQGLEASSYSGG